MMIKEFRCYEAKIEESEKASRHWELNPGHLWLEPGVLQKQQTGVAYIHCGGGLFPWKYACGASGEGTL